MDTEPVTKIRFRLDGMERSENGRNAWALAELAKAGTDGLTPITMPGPRWSSYVLKLRKKGISIETQWEKHDGPYRGEHARYVLRSPIEILEIKTAPAGCAEVANG